MRVPENANLEVDEDGFSPIWRYEVYGADGKIWCATGNVDEARRSMRHDDVIYCVWEKREFKRKALDGKPSDAELLACDIDAAISLLKSNGYNVLKINYGVRNPNADKIIELRKSGNSYEKIARVFGLTRERVRQIYMKYSDG